MLHGRAAEDFPLTFHELLAEVAKAGVEFEARAPTPADPDGHYDPPLLSRDGKRTLAKARICIYLNRDFKQTDPREPDDTITLAHELGHHRRYALKQRRPEYESFLAEFPDRFTWKEAPEAGRRLVLEEEQGAWEHAWEILSTGGFEDRAAFEAKRRNGLAVYRELLGLPE